MFPNFWKGYVNMRVNYAVMNLNLAIFIAHIIAREKIAEVCYLL